MFNPRDWCEQLFGTPKTTWKRQRRRCATRLAIEWLEDRSLLANAHLAVIGDFGNGSAAENSVAAQLKTTNPEFVITVGDNNYGSGSGAGWDTAIGNSYHEFIRYPATGSGSIYAPDGATPHVQPAINEFIPSLGNHDWDAGVTGYTNYFELPGNERYFDFVKGPIHFFVLDSDPREPDGITVGSVQYNWFANTIATSTSEWQVVYFHHPAYSSGDHGNTPAMQWDFAAKGVDAVLQGHDHSYERLSVGGIPYFVNGMGGASIRGFPNLQPGSQVRYNGDFGFMVVDASDTSMTFQFITDDGVVIDTYTLADGVPNAPAGLIATAVSNSQISLTWSDASNNETGFAVERSTNNIDFALVANLGTNATSYVDQTGLSPATTYYYRVMATSALGDSLPSNVANATTLAANIATPIVVGATWKYLDNGTDQGTAWRATSFVDSTWSSGAAQLGYGDGDEQTVVGYGGNASNKYVTTYFRNTFNLANASAFSTLNLRLMRDDGAVVYLNGTEVFRSNMPSGTVGYQTLASAAVGGADESTYYSASISPSLLVNGNNTLAVEIHQSGVTSSDISFNAELSGTTNTVAPVLANIETAVLPYTENGAAVAVTTALAVSDANSPNLTGATVSITSGFTSGQDVLGFVNQGGIAGSYSAATGVLTLSGSAAVSVYQAALRSVTYFNSSDSPNTVNRTISFVVSDEVPNTSNTASRTITVTAVNDPPVLSQPANQTLNNDQTLPVTLAVTDPDTPAASLVYTASRDDMGYVLKQQYGFGAESTATYNWGGQQEKWFKQTSGSTTTWYFITPNGNFYRWGGGTPAQLLTTSTLLAQLHTVYYTTTTRLSGATSIASTAPVNNSSPPAVLTVDPPDTFVGTLRYPVSVSDGTSSSAKTFFVTVNQGGVVNQPPVLSQPANQTLGNNQTLPVTLAVTDPDTPAASLVYTASLDDMGFVLKQQYGLGAESTATYNWGGQQEKWLKGGTIWYFITPNGNFYRWGGGTPAQLLTTSTLLAQLHSVYYTNTARLSGATSIAATAPVNNSLPPAVLTIDPPDTFVGTLRYQVSVSDGTSSSEKSFLATVNSSGAPGNQPPVLSQPANQTLNNNQTLPVTLAVTDPDTPAASLVYTASLDDYGYILDQQYGLAAETTTVYNWGGQQEKWFKAGTTWYFILPSGAFYRWGGGTPAQMLSTSTLVAQLHTVYYTTTTRLSSAASIAASAPVNNSSPPAVLTVDPPDTFVGTLRYQVSVSDGTSSDAKTFNVRVS